MSDSIQKVTLENAAEQLKLKIRNAFVELLPDEQWKEMVATELKRFTQPTETDYRGKVMPSAFSVICNEVFADYLKAEIKAVLQSPEWRENWGTPQPQISVAIKAWLTENSAQLIQSTVQALASQAAQNLITGMAHR